MIETRDNKDPNVMRRGLLFIDGIFEEHANVSSISDAPFFTITSRNEHTSRRIAAHSVSDFPVTPQYLQLMFYPNNIEHQDIEHGIIILKGTSRTEENVYTISLHFGGDALTEWKALYSFADYAYEMVTILKSRDDVRECDFLKKDETLFTQEVRYAGDDPYKKLDISQVDKRHIHTVSVGFLYSSLDIKIEDEVARISEIISKVHTKIVSRISSLPRQNSVVVSFDDFPDEIRTPCEQYLLYFSQFLLDLGVNAPCNIDHHAGKVLFTVTPSNEHEALNKIRTALDIYLRLPSSPVSNDASNEIAIQRLESSVLRLQSDLRLASAELQAKNTTLEAQQLIISVQKRLLSGEIFTDVITDETPKPKDVDREELFGGTVALTVFKKGGAEFSLAKIYRLLKEHFTEKSSD